MNTPYTKEMNHVGNYLHSGPNRAERRFNGKSTKVTTNRKTTLGRNIYFQNVVKIVGTKPVNKTIKHIQETPNAIKRKIALLNFFERIEILKSKWHKANPEFQKKAS